MGVQNYQFDRNSGQLARDMLRSENTHERQEVEERNRWNS